MVLSEEILASLLAGCLLCSTST